VLNKGLSADRQMGRAAGRGERRSIFALCYRLRLCDLLGGLQENIGGDFEAR
jgi:hypothetical protein